VRGPIYEFETVELGAGRMSLDLRGELDLLAREDLRRELDAVVTRAPSWVLVDLTSACFADAATIGMLEAAQTRLRAAGAEMVLACEGSNLPRVLRLMRLDDAFTIFASRAEAIAGRRAAYFAGSDRA
jgi:anti-sigma B factor antagonist